MHRLFCSLLLVFFSGTALCQSSRIIFTSTPADFTEGLTPALTLLCALNDEASSTTVDKVTSIVIRRAEDQIQREVGRIVSGKPATAGSWAAGAKVTGDLSNTKGHLQATWSSPKPLHAGRYNCEIVAQETDGTNIKFKSKLQVEGRSQISGELPQWLSQAQDKIAALKQAVGDLKTNGNPVDKKDISECKNEIDSLKQVISDMKANFCNNSLTHSEQGTVVCRQSNGWGDKCQLREETKHVRFSVPYAKTPVVSLAAVSVDVDDISKYSLKVRDLTTAGFTVVCATWWDTNINSLEVQWTSVAA